MVVVINGAIGTGKTTVAWELLNLFERAVMLDGDYFAAIQPFSIHSAQDLAYVYAGIAHQVTFHRAHGFENFIINYVLETPEELQKLANVLPQDCGVLHKFVLVCEQQERERRIRERKGDDVEWELSRSAQLTEILAKNNAKYELGPEVDTTSLRVSEVAQYIYERINKL